MANRPHSSLTKVLDQGTNDGLPESLLVVRTAFRSLRCPKHPIALGFVCPVFTCHRRRCCLHSSAYLRCIIIRRPAALPLEYRYRQHLRQLYDCSSPKAMRLVCFNHLSASPPLAQPLEECTLKCCVICALFRGLGSTRNCAIFLIKPLSLSALSSPLIVAYWSSTSSIPHDRAFVGLRLEVLR